MSSPAPRDAVVLTVWEPVAVWEPYDPATVLSVPLSRLASNALGLDEIARDLAQEKLAKGVELARQAGFQAQGRAAKGKAWQATCEVAAEVEAEVVVLGAHGLGRVESALLGSVSSGAVVHGSVPGVMRHHEHRALCTGPRAQRDAAECERGAGRRGCGESGREHFRISGARRCGCCAALRWMRIGVQRSSLGSARGVCARGPLR